jgi:hypothetical protein
MTTLQEHILIVGNAMKDLDVALAQFQSYVAKHVTPKRVRRLRKSKGKPLTPDDYEEIDPKENPSIN